MYVFSLFFPSFEFKSTPAVATCSLSCVRFCTSSKNRPHSVVCMKVCRAAPYYYRHGQQTGYLGVGGTRHHHFVPIALCVLVTGEVRSQAPSFSKLYVDESLAAAELNKAVALIHTGLVHVHVSDMPCSASRVSPPVMGCLFRYWAPPHYVIRSSRLSLQIKIVCRATACHRVTSRVSREIRAIGPQET